MLDPHAESVPPSPSPEDPAPRLAGANARAPEVRAALADGPPRPRRPGLRALAIVGVALLVVVGAGALALRARRSPAPERLTLLAPVGAAGATADGERTAPFSGFALQVETEPAGAVVEVDGVIRGESPVFAGIECAPGARVVVRARSRGAAAERTTTCRKDTLVGLTLRLGR
jgi:hypothetical protein